MNLCNQSGLKLRCTVPWWLQWNAEYIRVIENIHLSKHALYFYFNAFYWNTRQNVREKQHSKMYLRMHPCRLYFETKAYLFFIAYLHIYFLLQWLHRIDADFDILFKAIFVLMHKICTKEFCLESGNRRPTLRMKN